MKIVPYSDNHVSAVREFNERLARAGMPFTFPERALPLHLPKLPDGRPPYQEYFVAVDDAGMIRGGYILKRQGIRIGGEPADGGMLRWPISEGIVDARFANVGPMLIRHAVQTLPHLLAVGMGGPQERLPRMLRALQWTVWSVPFLFRVVRPVRFLRNIEALRTSRLRRAILDAAAWSGLGATGIRVAQGAKRLGRPRPARPRRELAGVDVPHFGEWADAVWLASKLDYHAVAVRDTHTLNALYPPGERRLFRLRVNRDHRVVGWAVLLATQMQGHPRFGDLRVGTVADGLAAEADVPDVVAVGVNHLLRAGVDLIVTNQTHPVWRRAFEGAGFLPGPSNFAVGLSRPLRERLGATATADLWHLNRGDGDGPINL